LLDIHAANDLVVGIA